jgi:hypothetical protein
VAVRHTPIRPDSTAGSEREALLGRSYAPTLRPCETNLSFQGSLILTVNHFAENGGDLGPILGPLCNVYRTMIDAMDVWSGVESGLHST